MNVHVKIWDMKQERDMLKEIVALIRKYDAQKHAYFTPPTSDAASAGTATRPI